ERGRSTSASVTERNTSELDLQRVLDFARPFIGCSLTKVRRTVCNAVCLRIDVPHHSVSNALWTKRIELSMCIRIGCRLTCACKTTVDDVVMYPWNIFRETLKLNLIKDVEELHAELECNFLSNFEILVN